MKFSANYNPATTAFVSMRKDDLKEFYEWFMLNLPYFVEELMQLVRRTQGFESWSADCSPGSLESLGVWLAGKIEKRKLTADEIVEIEGKLGKGVENLPWDLTDETRRLIIYVGMYYGDVALNNLPDVRWEQQLGSKRLADYGQPTIVGEGVVPINPVRIVSSFAYGVASGEKSGGNLREMYDYWANLSVKKRGG